MSQFLSFIIEGLTSLFITYLALGMSNNKWYFDYDDLERVWFYIVWIVLFLGLGYAAGNMFAPYFK